MWYPCLCKEPRNLVVGRLAEVLVPRFDRVERGRLFENDDLVGLLTQLLYRVGSGHRCGQEDALGA